MKKQQQKPLFNLSGSTVQDEPKKKHGRPKKVVETISQPIEEPVKKKRGRPKKSTEEVSTPVENIVEKPKRGRPKKEEPQVKQDTSWKKFCTESKPDILVPVEFYVDKGSTPEVFRGYRAEKFVICTDEPYKLSQRKKYNNLFYREIEGCQNVNNCPSMFPSCESCPIYKERNKKK